MKFDKLLEALKLSVAKDYTKGWDRTRFDEWFKGENRIYMPLVKDISLSQNQDAVNPVESEVVKFLNKLGYDAIDYKNGLAKDDFKRSVKIGRVLMKFDTGTLLKKFNNDNSRSLSKSLKGEQPIVVISRHPYDIAGMSTDRNWTSCKDLARDGNYKKQGEYSDSVKDESKLALIAYLIRADDKNIKQPLMRVLIVPYENKAGKILMHVPSLTYGDANKEVSSIFIDTVKKWLDDNQKVEVGVYNLHNKIYDDGYYKDLFVSNDYDIDNHPENINKMIADNNLNDDDIIEIVKSKPKLFRYIDNTSEIVKINAVSDFKQENVRYIKNPSEAVQLAAIKQIPGRIRYIENPTEDVQLKAVTSDTANIEFIKNPSEKVQLAAVNKNPLSIKRISNPNEKVQIAAVSANGSIIKHLIENGIEVSEPVMKAAIDSKLMPTTQMQIDKWIIEFR